MKIQLFTNDVCIRCKEAEDELTKSGHDIEVINLEQYLADSEIDQDVRTKASFKYYEKQELPIFAVDDEFYNSEELESVLAK